MLKLPFFYTDWIRANRGQMARFREECASLLGGRRTVIVGSAPAPVFPAGDEYAYCCVNGSGHSLANYRMTKPDITFLAGSLFLNETAYSNATLEVIARQTLGHVITTQTEADKASGFLKSQSVNFKSLSSYSLVEKRLILGKMLGISPYGTYKSSISISSGVLMSILALWAGAKEVVIVGFSFNDQHEYSKDKILAPRRHTGSDKRCLKLLSERGYPVTTTSEEISRNTGIPLASV